MAEQFNEKEGLLKALKTALRSDGFILAVFDMLFGDENAAKRVEFELKRASQENTLNEMVSVHRFFKSNLDESKLEKVRDMLKARGLFKKMGGLKGKSVDFYRKVLIETLKKPGQITALLYMVKAVVTLGYPIDDVIAMPVAIKFFIGLLETAVEVAGEEKPEEQLSLDEQIALNRLRRNLKHTEKAMLKESFDPDTNKWVSLFVGRFQPFTLGHVKCLIKLREAYKVPIVICAIPVTKEKSDKEHPFYGELQDEMYERLRTGLNDEFPGLIADVTYVPNAYIGGLVDTAKSLGFQPIGWGCGTDRYEIKTLRKRKKKETDSDYVISGYKPQTDAYIAKQRELDAETQNINPDNFNLLHIQRDVAGEGDDPVSKISGTKVREAILNNDRATFERMVPKCLYGLFDGFKSALEEIYGNEPELQGTAQEPAYQTITESKAYKDFKKYLNKGLNKLLK